ncbi:MAG: (2Fe-2S) ferredoxin domain-containing protein [Bacteroidales bacterium]
MVKRYEIRICLGSSCFSRGNKELVQFVKEYLAKNHLDDRVVFRGARCMGHCNEGPVIVINDRLIRNVGQPEIESILDEEFGNLI